MIIHIPQSDDWTEDIQLSVWLKERIGPYAEFSPKLGHFEGPGWSMKSVMQSDFDKSLGVYYKWFWEVAIEDDELATEFAMRFL